MPKKITLKQWKKTLRKLNRYYLNNGYHYNSNPKKAGGKTINCVGFPMRALYHLGIIPKKCIYAYTSRGRLVGTGAATIKKKCTYKKIDMPFYKAVNKGKILPGDIVGYRKTLSGKWAAHTEIYIGIVEHNGKRMHKFWNYSPDFRQRRGVSYRPLKYKRLVGCIIRIKNLVR